MVSEKTDVLYLTRDDMFFFNEEKTTFEDVDRTSFTPLITKLIFSHGVVIFTDTDGRKKILKTRR